MAATVFPLLSPPGGLLILGRQTGDLLVGGSFIKAEGLFNFPSKSKKKAKPNTDRINRFFY